MKDDYTLELMILQAAGIITYPSRPPLDIEPGPEPQGDSAAYLACSHTLDREEWAGSDLYRRCACGYSFTKNAAVGREAA